ncbi:MAG: hypothetical protein JXM70_24285 [Pirellulales bacterium]|nr:hypothetical protein [Pirellulales bacterium]
MNRKPVLSVIAISFSAVLAALPCPVARSQDHGPVRADSRPQLVRKIEFGQYGSKYARLGDLSGNGQPEVLLVQVVAPEGENKAIITCLTVVDLEGHVLWQVGKPDINNIYFGSDFPVQIYDFDRDGKNEVLYIPDAKNVLTILEGKTGKVLKKVQLAGGHDSILFADFSGNGYAQELLVKDRYSSFWVYDKNFNLLWSKLNCNPGHYPMEYDLDGDGRDELLCGYTLYAHDGRVLWSHPFPGHNDAVYIDDMDGDGKAEIAIAASNTRPGEQSILLNAEGKILFRRMADHSQHALIGKFCPDLPGKQVFFIDRQMHQKGRPIKFSELSLFNRSGEKLLSIKDNIWYLAGEVIDNWVGSPKENSLGLYSRGFAPPCLLDGLGRQIAVFPLPEAIKEKGGGPGGKDLYDDFYMQHLDYLGDNREEIFCYNHKALYIWTNAAPMEKPVMPNRPARPLKQVPRLYNNNFYPGRL